MKHGVQPTLTLTQLLDEFHVFAASVIGSLPALPSRRCRHAWLYRLHCSKFQVLKCNQNYMHILFGYQIDDTYQILIMHGYWLSEFR